MKRRATIVRLAAIASSVLIAAVYVSCRVAAPRADGPQTPAAPAAAGPEKETFFGGSKSMEIVSPSVDRGFIGGSKSAPIVTEPDIRLLVPPPPPPKPPAAPQQAPAGK